MIKNNIDALVFFVATLLVGLLLSSVSEANSGKALYQSRCTSCHNTNPTKPGNIGPDIASSSLELITLKTQKREYPKGYKPKRKTRVMPRIVLTEKQLKELHAYISSFAKGKK
jgi:mono/diheme cytochrome c family protein